LSYGHYQEDNNEIPQSLDQSKIKKLTLTRLSIERMKKLPVTTSVKSIQLGKDWTKAIFDLNRNKFFYLDRNTNILYQTSTLVFRKSAGLATTRSACNNLGVQVSSVKEFNNSSVCVRYSSWPKPYIPGLLGYCCPLAAYYICEQLTREQVAMLQELYHAPKAMENGTTIFATDGTYTIIDGINALLKDSALEKIYPTKEDFHLTNDAIESKFLGDANLGKFLIELYDRTQESLHEFSHFISVDTCNMEIYDPTVQDGAIKMDRNIFGQCLLVESMGYHRLIVIKKIWKLKKKKKRTGKKRIRSHKLVSDN